ncbi:hypothetical protein ABZ215_14865 [Amycolatopsis sp. NPDC006131]|uniref:hypothetical protein n=1 Tax=Amycolatopsis sp. NPDC006131 TaxID=3156731 RepID=UPI0033BD919B
MTPVLRDVAALEQLATAPGVIDHSGPYPVVAGKLEVSGPVSDVNVEGRDTTTAAAVNQPVVARGSWVSDGGMVLETPFAGSLGAGAILDPRRTAAARFGAGPDTVVVVRPDGYVAARVPLWEAVQVRDHVQRLTGRQAVAA